MEHKLSVLLFVLLLSCTALRAQEKAVPREGEGINAFLLRHNRPPGKYYQDFVKLNQKALGRNIVLKAGTAYLIPPLKGTGGKAETGTNRPGTVVREPLFGRQLADVTVTGNRLAGACFYLVSGHGGPDPGAIGRVNGHELHEDEYAYDIILRLARLLIQEGAEVRIIIQDAKDGIREETYLSNSKRETCMGDPIPLNQTQRLQQRCSKINALYQNDRRNHPYCRAIFIHVDSRSKGKQTDVFFYHSGKSAESKRLATRMRNTFETNYRKHQPNRGFSGTVGARNLYVLSHTVPVSVFVELGNIQNPFDQRRLVMNSNRQALAKWITEGFLKDFSGKE